MSLKAYFNFISMHHVKYLLTFISPWAFCTLSFVSSMTFVFFFYLFLEFKKVQHFFFFTIFPLSFGILSQYLFSNTCLKFVFFWWLMVLRRFPCLFIYFFINLSFLVKSLFESLAFFLHCFFFLIIFQKHISFHIYHS